MHRYFIAFVVTATVAITAFSAKPARASDQDLARALAGIAVLAIIGKAIHDHNKDDDRVRQKSFVNRQTLIEPRPLPNRVSRRVLPRQCLRTVETRNGNTRRVLGARCLERNYRFSSQLPRSCARQVETRRGWRWAYGARCLRQNGYQIARYE